MYDVVGEEPEKTYAWGASAFGIDMIDALMWSQWHNCGAGVFQAYRENTHASALAAAQAQHDADVVAGMAETHQQYTAALASTISNGFNTAGKVAEALAGADTSSLFGGGGVQVSAADGNTTVDLGGTNASITSTVPANLIVSVAGGNSVTATPTPKPIPALAPETPGNTNTVSPTSTFGSVLSKIPLIGGMLSTAGDILTGVVNTTVGLVTFGASGTLGTGLNQIGTGTGNLVKLLGTDAVATVAGAVGTVWTTAAAMADVVTLGNAGSGGNPIKAVGRLIANVAIPEYGMFGGFDWGTKQNRTAADILNQSDVASFYHDRSNGNETLWIKLQYTTHPTATPVGPVGAAYALLGTVPFGLKGLSDGDRYP